MKSLIQHKNALKMNEFARKMNSKSNEMIELKENIIKRRRNK